MENPWQYLPRTSPYVLDCDRAAIEGFNAHAPDGDKFCLKLLPEPFLGDVHAPVVLLGLNPGFSKDNAPFYTEHGAVCRDNLVHAVKDYPFYLLNTKYETYSGPTWWRGKLNWLIKDCGLEAVAARVCCIEFFPYHSGRFHAHHLSVESQQYSFHLVRQAIQANALIVMMRAANMWLHTLPELKAYSNRCKLRNVQRSWLSPANFEDGWYTQIVERIRRS